LDSKRLDLFQEALVDKCNRFKLRIRGYDDEPDGSVFFEIKRRLNRVIYKSRAKARKDQIKPILERHLLPTDISEKDRDTFQQLIHYAQSLDARPVILVRYMRQAFENPSDTRIRITFDRLIRYQLCHKFSVKLNGGPWRKPYQT
jgi:SPX domain protein involved in polyphosphate accumulation